jgi:XTP/dITP diphosphohydrolase
MMLIIATHNTHKLQEISEILAPIACIGAKDFQVSAPEETGFSFLENALIKARALCLHTQKPVIADDSGLVVPALNGAPGIFSSRYAGPDSNDKKNCQYLLRNMQDVQNRDAYYYCAMIFLRHAKDPTPLIGLGRWDGVILKEPRGQNGFGYDPLFWLESQKCSAAELEFQVKNQISHRAQALLQLKKEMIHDGLIDNS